MALKSPDRGHTRRKFIKGAGISALGFLLAGVPPLRGGLFAGDVDGPEVKRLKIGFIPLTDCASVVMAYELGLYKKYGLEVTVSKEASWAGVRDKLSIGDIQASHILYGMPYASTLGITGAEGQKKPMVIPMALNQNGQAITLSKDLSKRGVKTAKDIKRVITEDRGKKTYTFAMTFPPGTHAMWVRYWLAWGGVDPDNDVKLITIPPPQMVANMRIGNMDGFCVGEPWNARAIADGIGFTATTTQQIWKNHPEKVLGMTQEFAEKNPKTVKAMVMAIIEASQYIDKIENRPRVAEVIARKEYVNCPVEVILGRIQGKYDYGDGRTEQDPHYMKFYRDGEVNFPLKSHGLWFLTQQRRWGFIEKPIDYKKTVDAVNRTISTARPQNRSACRSPKKNIKRKSSLMESSSIRPTRRDMSINSQSKGHNGWNRMSPFDDRREFSADRKEAVGPRVWVEKIDTVILPLVTFLVVIGLWALLSNTVASRLPGPVRTIMQSWDLIRSPFFDNGPNSKGLGWQLLYSLGRVAVGFGLAALVGVPVGFLIGASNKFRMALDPLIQILRPVSPLAWLPIGLATFQAANPAATFVIFITSLWPIVLNTAFGVAHVNPDYLSVARILKLSKWQTLKRILFPATLPYIFTGLKIAVGVAWLVIVAVEMLTGGVGIGFFVWDEWNSLSLEHIILAILVIGGTGLALDRFISAVARRYEYVP